VSLINRVRLLLRMSALRQAVQLTLVFLLIVVVAGLASILFVDREISAQIDAELESRADEISTSIETNGLNRALFYETEDRFAIFEEERGLFPKPLGARTGYDTVKLDGKKPKDDLDGVWRVYTVDAGRGVLVVGTNLDDKDDYLEVLINIFAVSGGATLVVMVTIGGFLGWRAQKRFSTISGVLERVAGGDLSARVEVAGGNDDFDRLARDINRTTARLEILLRQTRNLTANIAHDLKTPLTRLQAQLEAIEKTPGDTGAVEKALAQTDEMIALFEALLRIAELETGEHRRRFETLNLSRLAEEAGEIYRAVVEDSGRHFELKAGKTAEIAGDRRLLLQAIANLIENSLKHTPEGTRLTLVADVNSISLSDNGPGIPEAYRDRVFEPMYRLEESRTTPGSGLGLALVRTIATLHGAQIFVTDNPDAGPTNPGLKIELRFSPGQPDQ